mmetsp:Transcript_14037/g.40303  ORF Transcript_14037/g.40303 Transcript_14037/m.40303 type:complete len:479 (-) Transcript_14037:94-1530(-)
MLFQLGHLGSGVNIGTIKIGERRFQSRRGAANSLVLHTPIRDPRIVGKKDRRIEQMAQRLAAPLDALHVVGVPLGPLAFAEALLQEVVPHGIDGAEQIAEGWEDAEPLDFERRHQPGNHGAQIDRFHLGHVLVVGRGVADRLLVQQGQDVETTVDEKTGVGRLLLPGLVDDAGDRAEHEEELADPVAEVALPAVGLRPDGRVDREDGAQEVRADQVLPPPLRGSDEGGGPPSSLGQEERRAVTPGAEFPAQGVDDKSDHGRTQLDHGPVHTAATATATALHKAGIVINPLQIERLTLNHEPSPQHENHPHGTPPGAHFGATPWRYADTAAVISGEVVVLVALAIQQKVLILLVAHHVLRQKQLARRGDVEGIGTDSSPALTTTAAPVRNFAPTSARVGAVRQVGHAGAGEDRAVGQIEGRFRHRRRRGGACWTCCRAPMFAGHPWQLVGRWGGNVQRLLARWRCHCRTFDSFAAACCV